MKKRKKISNTELKILELVSKGNTSIEIGKTLGYSVGTVENYVKSLLIKTNAINRVHLVYLACKEGII